MNGAQVILKILKPHKFRHVFRLTGETAIGWDMDGKPSPDLGSIQPGAWLGRKFHIGRACPASGKMD